MAKDKKDVLILALVLVIAALILVLGYLFLVRPAINGMVVQGYNQGAQVAILTIAQQAAQCSAPVPITVGNQTINLIAVECLQQAQK